MNLGRVKREDKRTQSQEELTQKMVGGVVGLEADAGQDEVGD